MKGYKEVLRKEYYQTRIYETLFIKLLEYCIEHKQTLQEVINDSLFEKLKIDKEQLLEEEKELTKRVDKNFSVWTSICEKKSRLRKQYEDEVVGHYKYILIDNNKNTLQFLVKGNTDTLMKVELDKETNFIKPLIIDNERNHTPRNLPLEVLKGICQFCEETKEV